MERHQQEGPHHVARRAGQLRLIGPATENLGWLTLGVSIIALLIGAVFLALPSRSQKWPSVPATIIDVRVVSDVLGVEGARRTPVYRGEVLLQYSVSGNSHTLWTDAGFDRDPEWLSQDIRIRAYSVRYNPKHPEEARAERR
jgi:hypothetical protein